MYTLSSSYLWRVSGNSIILTKNQESYNTDLIIKKLPDEIRINPEDMITLTVSDVPHHVMGVAKAATSVAIGTALLGPVGLVMGAASGAKDIAKENQREKEVYFQFRRSNDDTIYDYYGRIPSNCLVELDGIRNSSRFGKNASKSTSSYEREDNSKHTNQKTQNNNKPSFSDISKKSKKDNGNKKTNPNVRSNININQDNPTPTIIRIKLFLEDSEWDEALRYCDAALDLFPDNSIFYLLKYCAIHNMQELGMITQQSSLQLTRDKLFKKALRFSSDDSDDAKSLFNISLMRDFNSIISKSKEAKTSNDLLELIKQLEYMKDYYPVDDIISRLKRRSFELLYVETQSKYDSIMESVVENDARSMLKAVDKLIPIKNSFQEKQGELSNHLEDSEKSAYDLELGSKIGKTIEKMLEEIYTLACEYQCNYTEGSLTKADNLFKYLKNYKDSEQRRKTIKKDLRDISKEKSLQSRYLNAREAESMQEYERAIRLYEELGTYKDSKDRIQSLYHTVTITNECGGIRTGFELEILGHGCHALPRGVSHLKLLPGKYVCSLYIGNFKQCEQTLLIPEHNQIRITHKFLDGYRMVVS